MTEVEVAQYIQQLGFPMFVALWMLVKDQKEKVLTREALTTLTIAVNNLEKAVGRHE